MNIRNFLKRENKLNNNNGTVPKKQKSCNTQPTNEAATADTNPHSSINHGKFDNVTAACLSDNIRNQASKA